jgi:hypothetical protein
VDAFKNIVTGLLLCCVLIDPVVATFTWLHCQKTIVKKEINRQIIAGIERDNLVLLQFSKEESQTKLRWEHPEEFEYNRQMYDVVKVMNLGETVYYWCLLDHKETKLNRQLEKLTAQTFRNDPKIKGKNGLLISFFKSLYSPVFKDWNGLMSLSLGMPFRSFLYSYASITIQPPTPPPQLG